MKVVSLKSFFDNMLDGINENARMHTSYALRCGCIKMASPRHPRYEMFLNVGMSDVDVIFDHSKTFSGSDLSFVFPERFMSVHEQQAFIHALEKHPDFVHVNSVDIITSSPLVIGAFRRENILIVTHEDDFKHSGSPINKEG